MVNYTQIQTEAKQSKTPIWVDDCALLLIDYYVCTYICRCHGIPMTNVLEEEARVIYAYICEI
jgi:hypothetical protein